MFRQQLRSFKNQVKTYSSRRLYSTKNAGSNRLNHLVPLSLLGIAAIGLTYYNVNTTNKPPRASIDPLKSSPIFPSENDNNEHKARSEDFEPINVLFVLGGPGSGKGTQCSKLVRDFDFVHLSAGDLLRKEQNTKNSEFGELIGHYIKEGLIVPQEITINLLKNEIINEYKNGKRRFLIDGFPRKMDQAISFENSVSEGKLILYFECPEEVMLKRLLERGKTSGRTDDNLESIRKRFTTFIQTSMPVIDYFDEQGKVVKVNCNEPVDKVYNHVVENLKKRKIIEDQ